MFNNRIRLAMQLHSAQFPEERTVFRKANGVTKTLSVVIRKQYEVETDFLPEIMHQRLTIALAHDNITWEGDRFLGGVSKDGDYQIQWPEGVLHYPMAKAECKVQVTPFDASNSNCQTCEEATQLDLVDDLVSGGVYGAPLQEDTDYSASLADNDTICCYPAVFSLVSYNADYLTSATINPTTGVLSIHTGTNLVSANGLVIATYRVTCPNGGYDEANVYADIEGSIAGCLAPSDLLVSVLNPEDISFSWVAPGVGSFNYYWEIYSGTSPIGSPIQTGTTTGTTVNITGLDTDTQYYFQVRTTCVSSDSNFIGIATQTPPQSNNCGSYTVTFDTGSPGDFALAAYRNCNANVESNYVPYGSSRIFCMLQNSPGDPVFFSSNFPVTIIYSGLC